MKEQFPNTKSKLTQVTALLVFVLWYISASSGAWGNQDFCATASENTSALAGHIHIHGFVQGKMIPSGSISETGIELSHQIQKTNKPWFYSLSIIQHNKSIEIFKPYSIDSLLIKLGPLYGLINSNDSGVNAVASIKGKVQTDKIRSGQSFNLSWPANQIEWAGLQDRYYALLIFTQKVNNANRFLPFERAFVTAESTEHNGLTVVGFPLITFGFSLPPLAPGEQTTLDFLIFSGPKSLEALSSGPVNIRSLLFPNLPGWMQWLSFGLLRLLNAIFFIIPNWGLTIIVLALFIRLLLFPLAKKAMKSQQRFVTVQKRMLPELSEIKKNFKGGEQSERILQLYKKYKVSPFAGLKPLLIVLIQLPILIALYHVLGSVYELRDASFLWIDSLAQPDQLFYLGFEIPLLGSYFNLLPLLMAVFTLLSFKLSPAPAADKKDSLSQKIFMPLMAFGFFILFYSFPAGMVLYWTMANVFHLAQHKLIIKYT